jgi:hypothetical protein
MPKYSPSSYDDYFCLKPPLLLWIATLFLSRAISLPLAVGLGHFAGVSSDATSVLQRVISLETLLPSALAAAVLIAMFRRSPNASSAVRWVWSHGRTFLAAAAALDFALSIFALTRSDNSDGQPLSLVIIATVDFYFLVYVLFARRVRDTFAAFPLLATTQ